MAVAAGEGEREEGIVWDARMRTSEAISLLSMSLRKRVAFSVKLW